MTKKWDSMGGRPSELGTGRQRENPSSFRESASLTMRLKQTSGENVSPWKTLLIRKNEVDQDFVDTKPSQESTNLP